MDDQGGISTGMLKPTHVYAEQDSDEVWAQLQINITRELSEEQTQVLKALVHRFHNVSGRWTSD